jgi:putative ABC transport system permease protein
MKKMSFYYIASTPYPSAMGLDTWRQSIRRLLRQPVFGIGVVLVLAVTIGANTAIFTLVNGVLMRPLPLRDPARLVTFTIVRPGTDRQPLSLPDLADFEAQSHTLDGIVAIFGWSVNLTGSGDAERLQGMRVSPDYFEVTGARAQLGRTIQSSDENQDVVLVSHGLWQRVLGGAPEAIGRTLVLNGQPFTIAGVLPSDFVSLVRDVDVVAPFSASADPRRANRAQAFLRVIARTKSGVTLGQVADDLDSVSRRMRAVYPDAHGSDTGVLVRSLHEEVTGRAAPMLHMLLAAVAVMMLVACANTANLFLVRGAARRRELAMRAALGATRGRIVAQLVAEAALLAAAGGALGLLVARALVHGLLVIGPDNLPRAAEIALDWRAALFTLGLSLGASLLTGVVPAMQAARGDLRDALNGGGRTVSGGSGRLRTTLIVAEVALSTILIITAALLARSFQSVTAVDPGFRASDVLTIRLSLPRARYDTRAAIENFYHAVHPRIAAIPGVRAAAAANVVPMNGYLATTAFFIDGVVAKDAPEAHYRMISPDYFRALGIELRAGRAFTPADRSDSQPVAIVNETFARQYWPGKSPIGARMRLDDGEQVPRMVDVVGVIADVKHFGLERETTIEVYVPISQVPEATTIWLANNMYWVLQTTGAPLAAANAVRREIAAVDAGVPASFVRSMDQWMGVSIATRRFNLQLVSAFALAALLLAVVGVYAVSASGVAMRTREIGVRTALGASKGEVVGLVLRDGIAPVLVGLIIGTAGASVLGRATASLLYGVTPHDPASVAVAGVTVITAALFATYVPARRAGRVDPIIVLRTE